MVKKNISSEDMEDICLTDGELSISDFSMSLVQAISDAGPWGQSFPEPLFLGKFKVLDRYIVGKNHLKLKLQLVNDNTTLDAIAFNKKIIPLDGNIERLLKRILNLKKDKEINKENLHKEKKVFGQTSRSNDYVQALMEIGALICKPKNPNCKICPITRNCL